MHNVSDAGLYTDFSGLAKLRAKAAAQSDEAGKSEVSKEVAKQFESLFLQMMLKSMRDASSLGESAESDQTKFYQEMFDKQIALDLSNNGDGIGIAKMLQQQLSGNPVNGVGAMDSAASERSKISDSDPFDTFDTGLTEATDLTLIRQQIERSTSSIQSSNSHEQNSGQE